MNPTCLIHILSPLLFLVICNLSFAYSIQGFEGNSVEHTSTLIEKNPDYIPYVDSGSDEDLNSDDSEDDDDYDDTDGYDDSNEDDTDIDEDSEEDEEDSKTILNKTLSVTSKNAYKSIEFFKKNRTMITVALALFAFRREISSFIIHLTTTPTKDGGRKLIVRMSPTSIIKIVLFIDVMRKMQHSGSGYGDDQGQPSSSTSGGGMIGKVIRDMLFQSNPAFLPPTQQHYTFETINDRFTKDENAWQKATSVSSSYKRNPDLSAFSLFNKTISSSPSSIVATNTSTVVMEMKLDSSVNTMPLIRDQISYLIHQHYSNIESLDTSASAIDVDSISNVTIYNETGATEISNHTNEPPSPIQMEVIILLESPGGSATDYGLASNQIERLRNVPGIKVTICVDKVAASGGYMMACLASPGQLFAAPFAILGSIGVYGQTLNIHNALQNYGVKSLVFRGGKDKAPVGLVGEITKEGIAKVQDMIDKTHSAFKRHVVKARPILAKDIDEIATGDVWLGHDAKDIGLVDQIITSDEYIWDKIQKGEKVLKLLKFQRPRLGLFGAPRQGPVGLFHQSFQRLSGIMNDFQLALQKVNGILDGVPTQDNIDVSRIVSAKAVGVHK